MEFAFNKIDIEPIFIIDYITFQREDYDALFILDQQAYLDCYSASSLKHIRNTQYKDMK
jgi:hypothetical protein